MLPPLISKTVRPSLGQLLQMVNLKTYLMVFLELPVGNLGNWWKRL